MRVFFLTPVAGLLALAALLPLVARRGVERRAREVRELIRLPEPPPRSTRMLVGSLVALPTLLALAATQPVLDIDEERNARTDAAMYFVFDTSRSMLAASGARAPNRFERARAVALELRARLREVPAGVATVTDRTLPHLFPSIDDELFAATIERAIDVERPPPYGFGMRATTLGALSTLPTAGFFTPGSRRRVAFVLTDAESRPFSETDLGALFRRPPGVKAIFVRFWSVDERIYAPNGEVEREYRPDPRSGAIARQLATVTGGRTFDEHEVDRIVAAARAALGEGTSEVKRRDRAKIALAPYLAGLAFLPLGLLLWRRNL